MNGLIEQIALLDTIERYFNLSSATSIKGLGLLDTSECKGKVFLKFRCPDKHFPLYSFEVEFQVTREFFEKNLRKLLKIDV